MISHGPIRALSYHPDSAMLYITFEDSRHFTFFGVSDRIYRALADPVTRDRTMADHDMWAFRWIEMTPSAPTRK